MDNKNDCFVHPSSYVDEGATVGKGTKIWHFSHIQKGAVIGENCSLGQNVNIANNVKVGNGVRIQNNVSVYEGVELEDNVFCGPSCVFTNVVTPRAHFPVHGVYAKTLIKEGASLGANSTVVCGHTVGRSALIAAGAVVTKDVQDYALMAGVPARRIGWVCECGARLDASLACSCGRKYKEENGNLLAVPSADFDRFQVPDSHTRIIYDKTGLYHAIQRFKETVQRTEARHRRRYDGSSGIKRLYHGPTRERARSRAGGVCRSETLHFVRQRYGRAHPRPESMEHRCGRCRIRARLHFLFLGRGHLAGRGHTRFVDVDGDTFNMDASDLERKIARTIEEGRLTPKVIITVDLFGLPANYPAIRKIADAHRLFILEDGAQGFGGMIGNKRACSFGDISTTSFFPAKPLGCYGDGGAVFTDNDEWAALADSYRVHGKGMFKYDNVRIGMNSRLDTLQAAILKIKFKAFREYELRDINKAAALYTRLLAGRVKTPVTPEGYYSSWAQYTICLNSREERDALQACLKEQGIPSMVYYPTPMHGQTAYKALNAPTDCCPTAKRLCDTVLSLPVHPYITEEEIEMVCSVILGFVR